MQLWADFLSFFYKIKTPSVLEMFSSFFRCYFGEGMASALQAAAAAAAVEKEEWPHDKKKNFEDKSLLSLSLVFFLISL